MLLFALVIALMFPAAPLMNAHHPELRDTGKKGIESMERHLIAPSHRVNPLQQHPSLLPRGIAASFDYAREESIGLPLIFARHAREFHIRLKRLLLIPLKYNSRFVAFLPSVR
ncbi:hypothetical protein KIH86_19365 [Paenibacillus sp. HN-1]|uniref:hypothetical protein n=1 Tax=Paenibacillus TaxID=44249 RepID=UPI001CA99FCC|nr:MULTISPECIES: hypothetical protein [Paenibacillus]MBY9082268.1 hypothetical protein [Paenibacillus sp. CGMCC 1.18879]MBY9086368.1 hypothetical protein [Paenibacillus sinensis]